MAAISIFQMELVPPRSNPCQRFINHLGLTHFHSRRADYFMRVMSGSRAEPSRSHQI